MLLLGWFDRLDSFDRRPVGRAEPLFPYARGVTP